MSDIPDVVDNPSEHRFETMVDGQLAELLYRRRSNRLVLVHAEVPDALSGHGIGGKLVEAAIAEAEREGLTVVPLCPFSRSWLLEHPDVAARVVVDWS
jgi:uncharacterized protein